MKKFTKSFISFMLIICMLTIPFEVMAARTTAPSSSNAYYYGSTNPFSVGQCTWYAWGRAHEYTGSVQNLPRGNAGGWYSTNVSSGSLKYGSTPKEGSIMVTHKNGYAADIGHVAFVESINEAAGTMVISEYNWSVSLGFSTATLSTSATTRGSHDVLGYIYLSDSNSSDNSDTQNPIGVMDSCTVDSTLRNIRIYGWAYDRSDLNTSIDCTVVAYNTAGKVRTFSFTASQASPDLGIAGSHRYDKTLNLSGLMGDITVELWGKNIGEGKNTVLATKQIYITTEYNPVSAIDGLIGNNDRSITMYGWTYDRDNRAKSTDVVVEVTGVDIPGITETFVFTADNKSSDLNVEGNHRFHETLQLQKLSGDVNVRVTAKNIGKGIDILVCEKQITVNPLLVYYNVMDPDSSVVYDINSLSGKVKFRFREYTAQDCYWKAYVADEMVVEHGESKGGDYEGYFVHIVDTDELVDNLVAQWTSSWTEDTVQTREEYIKSKCKIKCELYNSSNKKIGETEVYFTVNNDIVSAPGVVYYNLDSNGGTLDAKKISVAIGHSVGDKLPTPNRENYTFLGWYTSKDGGEKVTADFVASEDNQYTFYAHWSCNHNYESETTVQANCITEGEITYTCSVCGDSYTINIGYGDHTNVTINSVPATCTADGLTEGKFCIICEKVIIPQETIKATGHIETEIPAVDATCTETGLTAGIFCFECNSILSEQEIIPMIEHIDSDNDGFCDYCDIRTKECSCNCHKTGFINFLWKILNFFQKLFGLGKVCDCGISH